MAKIPHRAEEAHVKFQDNVPDNSNEADMMNNSPHPNVNELGGRDVGVVVDGSHPNAADLLPSKPRKKRSRRPASKRGIGAPTGMEEFFADAPMTPEEFQAEQNVYDLEIPFISRILAAIQRFERIRKLSPERRDVFYKWLQFGEIDVGPNMFAGGQNREDMDKDQMITALSNVAIPHDVQQDLDAKKDKSKFAVDFLGCMRGFLSHRATAIWSFNDQKEVQMVTSTLERFMDYLMQHNVCPEYFDDVLETRDFCRQASVEIWRCAEAQRWLPGDFNIACSTLFGGNFARDYDGTSWWGPDDEDKPVFVGLTPEKATQIIGFAIAGAGPEAIYQQYSQLIENGGDSLCVEKTITGQGFEIIGIERATADCKELYQNRSTDFRPVGIVYAKPWVDPEAPPEDLTEAEKIVLDDTIVHEPYLFVVEDNILQQLSLGQKILATIRKLNCGIWFFDEFIMIYPNFEVYLLNNLMLGWKEPKPVQKDANDGTGVTNEDAVQEEKA